MRALRPEEQQWLFTTANLHNTPSVDDGTSPEDELKRRKLAIEYMRSLALRATEIATAAPDGVASHLRGALSVGATLLHRFYMRRSFKDFPERLIAPTVLFLATKIEEEPLKLRHIVNACIAKFEPPGTLQWFPTAENNEQPSREYRHWERDVLVTEEILLETLCFHMEVEQPWVILGSGAKGIDGLSSALDTNGDIKSEMVGQNGMNGVNGNHTARITESIITELGWAILSESSLSPLSVFHAAPILAFAAFIIVLSFVERLTLAQAMTNAGELGERFHLDVRYSETGAQGSDVPEVRECLSQFVVYLQTGIIDPGLLRYLVPETETPTISRYPRRFRIQEPGQNGSAEQRVPAGNGEVKGEAESQVSLPTDPAQYDEKMIVVDGGVQSATLANLTAS